MAQTVLADPPGGARGWTQTFHDNFDGKALETRRWNDQFWWGSGLINDGALNYYSPSANAVTRGALVITARRGEDHGKHYTSGTVDTYKKFFQTYGYFEARLKTSKSLGVSGDFALSPEDTHWPPEDTHWPPEINIVECPGLAARDPKGNLSRIPQMTIHYADAKGTAQSITGRWDSGTDLSAAYHTYGLDWQPGLLVWYIDGHERFRSVVGVPDKPCYLVFMLGVSDDNSWCGPLAQATLPQTWTVDWVRAWKK